MTDSDVQTQQESTSGISPVIGVILMVAIVVVLAALIGVYALELSDSTESNVNAGVETDTTEEGVQVRLNSSGNAEKVVVLVNGSKLSGAEITDAGDSVTVSADEDDTVTIVGVGPDGNENTLQSVEPDEDTTGGSGSPEVVSGGSTPGEEVTGLVSLNPNIAGATVLSYDSSGSQIDTATTDENGNYSINAVSGGRLVVNATGETNYNGNPIYASAEKSVSDTTSAVDFAFDESASTSTTATVDGETIFVAYQLESSNENYVGNIQQLQGINKNVSNKYQLIKDIDAGETMSWNSSKGFDPISQGSDYFTGEFDGQGYTISKLYINRPSETRVGLFGKLDVSGVVKNVSVESAEITGQESAVLVASNDGTVKNSSVSGTVNGSYGTGGLVGQNFYEATIENSGAKVTVNGASQTGGLVGRNRGAVSRSYATGDVSGTENVGGLVGYKGSPKSVVQSYATGEVSGDNKVGGFVGSARGGEIRNSYTTGSVSGDSRVGGFVGSDPSDVTINTTFATGNVSGATNTGGFWGYYNDNGFGEINNSYWDVDSTGYSTSGGISSPTGLTTEDMQGEAATENMSGFNFTDVWTTTSGGYPELQNNPEQE